MYRPRVNGDFTFTDVRVAADEGAILDGVDLEVPASGITVIVGPSGAGKTTLLRLCNRLEVPTSGTVAFRGDDIAGLDPLDLRRRVGMAFQRPTVLGGSVRDNLAVAAPGSSNGRLAESLDRVELDRSLLDRAADVLSVGEAQRMCLARTLLTEPEALLADEPTAALDVGRRAGIERLVGGLAADGMPVLWVTHDLDQARRLADRTVVLVAGRVRSGDEAAAFLTGGADGG